MKAQLRLDGRADNLETTELLLLLKLADKLGLAYSNVSIEPIYGTPLTFAFGTTYGKGPRIGYDVVAEMDAIDAEFLIDVLTRGLKDKLSEHDSVKRALKEEDVTTLARQIYGDK